MEIVLVIALAGIWAVFLLPKFLSARRAPINSTRDFARTSQRLGALSAVAASPVEAGRRRARARRRRVLIGLIVLAVVTFLAAVASGSWVVLFINLIVDALVATYVALLLQIRERGALVQEAAVLAAQAEDAEALAG